VVVGGGEGLGHVRHGARDAEGAAAMPPSTVRFVGPDAPPRRVRAYCRRGGRRRRREGQGARRPTRARREREEQ
jgi:hypothetical protein